MLKMPLKETPLLERFIYGDNAFRDSRFKLIPYISKVDLYSMDVLLAKKRADITFFMWFSQGSWIVRQSVGRKSCLVGQALQMNYFRGKNYLEVKPMQFSNFFQGLLLSTYLQYVVSDMSISAARDRPRVINGGEGRGRPRSWIPQQSCNRNGICNTGMHHWEFSLEKIDGSGHFWQLGLQMSSNRRRLIDI